VTHCRTASTAVADVALFNCCPSVVCIKTLSKDTSRRDLQEAGVLGGWEAQQAPVGHGVLFHELSRSQVISPSQRPLPDNTQQSQQTDMPPVGFEPTISAGERPQTYALDRAVTGTG